MDKENILNSSFNHSFSLNERKNFTMNGVKKIDNFDEEEFFLDTVMGSMHIKGDNLELLKMDSVDGKISIKGIINSIVYVDSTKAKSKDNSIFNRLFK